MRFLTSALVILAAATSFVFADENELDETKIDVLHEVGCERKTTRGDTIEVHYRGTLASDGSEFDASYNRGQPLGFEVGAGMVIKGWDEGLLGMCIGEKRRLTIPSKYAYGDRGMPPVIPPKSTLIFETELVGIKGVEKDEL